MKDKLLIKLKKEIEKEVKSEADIAYILVLIRKILDTDSKLKDKYIILYFYCNWSLHIEIDRISHIEKVKEMINEFIKDNARSNFLDLNNFGKDFIDFLKEFEIDKNSIYGNTNSILLFTNLIRKLLVDSPLIIKNKGGFKVTITDSNYKEDSKITMVSFKVENF